MRKNNILMAAVLMGMMTLAACTSNDELTGGDDSVRHLTLNFSTRATDESTQESFTTGDKVKMFADDESTVFTLGSDGKWLNSDNKDYIAVVFPASITAAYPGTDDASTAAFSMPNVTDGIADQSTEAQLRAADYMTSDRWTLNAVPDGLDLVFRHHLCKVTIIISGYGDEFNGVLPTIASEKILSKGSGIAYTNAAWTATGSQTDITPLKTADATNGLHIYEAIITPGTYATGDNLMTLSVNGSTLTVPFAGTIESGKAYNFNIKVGKDNVTLTQVSALPGWGTEGEETEL